MTAYKKRNVLRQFCIPLIVLLLASVAPPVWSHARDMTLTRITLNDRTVTIEYSVSPGQLRQLSEARDLAESELLATVTRGWEVSNDDDRCALKDVAHTPATTNANASYSLALECARSLERVTVRYSLFGSSDDHENFYELRTAERILTGTFSSRHTTASALYVGNVNATASQSTSIATTNFLKLGFLHLVTGYDHILFLVGIILLPVGWRVVALWITTFTLAHSLTLAWATLGQFPIPPVLIEMGIALSIIVVAIDNWRMLRRGCLGASRGLWLRRSGIVLLFGFIHGAGLADALKDVALSAQTKWTALLTFNLGIELGQLLIAALVLPVLFRLAKTRWRQTVMSGACWCSGAAGSVWFLQGCVAL